MKTFAEVYEEVKNGVTTTKTGKVKKTFSRSDFDKLLKAFLNDYGYTTTTAGLKDGKVVTTDLTPVKNFRDTVITKLLVDAGHDKAEAAKIAAEYEFTNVTGLYEIMSEIIYQYMSAGKKFNFIPKEDFAGSLTIKEVPETVSEHSRPGKPELGKTKTKTKAHKVLDKKSKAPSWLKAKFE